MQCLGMTTQPPLTGACNVCLHVHVRVPVLLRVGRVGRADHMGLAISLVASLPEKVWFCTVKGYKPWLEPDAKNTKLQEQGGHTIW